MRHPVCAAASNAAAHTGPYDERAPFRKTIPHLRRGTSRRSACGMTHSTGALLSRLAARARLHAIPPAHRRSLRDARPSGLTNDTTLDTMAAVRSATI
ncbi:hypothetical protein BOSEA1005_12134 [Hyphomicrobiales bacterium]|nr:hypothetical protein BOSEA1005_12134 [Hyphomicrobiales bacterium]